jgi:hypothetical protein
MHRAILCLVVAGCVSASLSAQGVPKVVPQTYATVDAPTDSPFPYVYDKTRVQHLIQGDRFCASSAVLFGFAYRYDAVRGVALPQGFAIPNTTVTVGYSGSTAQGMATSFAANRQGTQTTVFQGTYNLPQQPAPGAVTPFNITYKWTQPFIFVRSQGNLLLEFVVPGQAQQKIQYPLDAVNSGVASVTRGTPGLFGDNSQSVLSLANPSQAQPGGSIQLLNRSLTQNYPTVHVYGFSNQSYGPLTLPLDLTPFGAPGNQLENALDLIVLTQASAGGGVWNATSKLAIPMDPAFDGLALYATSISADPSANSLGLVFGDGLGITVGGVQSSGMQMLYSSDSSRPTGNLFAGSGRDGGNVIELRGTFQ